MVYYRDNLANISLKAVCQKAENDLESARKAELLTRNEEENVSQSEYFSGKYLAEDGRNNAGRK